MTYSYKVNLNEKRALNSQKKDFAVLFNIPVSLFIK